MSKVFSAVITIVVATTAIVGASSGRMMLRKTWSSLAPSMRAASSSSVEMPFRPAERMTRAKPTHIQIPTMMIMNVLRGHSVSHDCGSDPDRAQPGVERADVPGSKSYMNFQITPAATKLIAIGMKISAFTTGLVADPIGEDRR